MIMLLQVKSNKTYFHIFTRNGRDELVDIESRNQQCKQILPPPYISRLLGLLAVKTMTAGFIFLKSRLNKYCFIEN